MPLTDDPEPTVQGTAGENPQCSLQLVTTRLGLQAICQLKIMRLQELWINDNTNKNNIKSKKYNENNNYKIK